MIYHRWLKLGSYLESFHFTATFFRTARPPSRVPKFRRDSARHLSGPRGQMSFIFPRSSLHLRGRRLSIAAFRGPGRI